MKCNKEVESAPTKAQMWEQILALTERCIDYSWRAGFEAGERNALEATMGIIEIDDVDVESKKVI